jgi:hypothetical protein
MPTKREREYYRMGFRDGIREYEKPYEERDLERVGPPRSFRGQGYPERKPKRKLSAWNKYIKNKRNHIKYRDGKLNLKKMAVAFRRKKRR